MRSAATALTALLPTARLTADYTARTLIATGLPDEHKQIAAAKSEAQKTVTQRQIDATDAEIDRLVYDLYGLTAEETAIVEWAAR